MTWLESFKIALIEENGEEIGRLIGTVPQFEKIEEMVEAATLIGGAIDFIDKERADLSRKMALIKKNKAFLEKEAASSFKVSS